MSGSKSITQHFGNVSGNGRDRVDARTVYPSIQRITGELISEIALHALDHYVDAEPVAATLDTKKGPWVLGHICSTWRDAVLSFPQLWSRIQINTEHFSGHPAARMENASGNGPYIVQEILRRSCGSSLKLSIKTFIPSVVMEVLIQHCHRWRSVCFYLFLEGCFCPERRQMSSSSTRRLDFYNL